MDLTRRPATGPGPGPGPGEDVARHGDLQTTLLLRSTGGLVMVGLVIALALLVVVAQLLSGARGRSLLQTVAMMGLVVELAWLWWGAAQLRIDASGVKVSNPLRWAILPWSAVDGARSDWGLKIVTAGRSVGVWACPARSSMTLHGNRHPDGLPGLRGPRATSTFSLDAQRAARVVEECRLEVLDEPGLALPEAGLTTGLHLGRLVVFAVLLLTLILSLH